MGTKMNPGAFDCYANAAEDEPMFVLLARDERAPELVRRWANVAEAGGTNPAKVAEARKCATDMEKWSGNVAGEPDASQANIKDEKPIAGAE